MNAQLLAALTLAILGAVSAPSGAHQYTSEELQNYYSDNGFKTPLEDPVEKLLLQAKEKDPSVDLDTLEGFMAASEKLCEEDLSELACFISNLSMSLESCDREIYSDLAAVYVSSFGGRMDDSTMVRKYVVEALKKHGEHCRPTYMAAFDEISKYRAYQKYRDTLDHVFEPKDMAPIFSVPFENEPALESMADKLRSSNLLDRIINGIGKDMVDYSVKTGEPLKDMLDRYPFHVCTIYNNFVADVFLPARLDLALDDTKFNEINPTNREDFNQAWIMYRLCDALLYDRDFFIRLLEAKF